MIAPKSVAAGLEVPEARAGIPRKRTRPGTTLDGPAWRSAGRRTAGRTRTSRGAPSASGLGDSVSAPGAHGGVVVEAGRRPRRAARRRRSRPRSTRPTRRTRRSPPCAAGTQEASSAGTAGIAGPAASAVLRGGVQRDAVGRAAGADGRGSGPWPGRRRGRERSGRPVRRQRQSPAARLSKVWPSSTRVGRSARERLALERGLEELGRGQRRLRCRASPRRSARRARADARVGGDPASAPWNSPSCHWRQSNQAGSRTRAASASAIDGTRGLGWSWYQNVTEAIR